MDKFFSTDVPSLPASRLDQMIEFALSHPQHAAAKTRKAPAWKFWFAFPVAACLLLALGALYLQPAPVQSGDAYSDVTELAILETMDNLGGF